MSPISQMDKVNQKASSEVKSTCFSIIPIIAVGSSIGCGYLFLFIYERELFFDADNFTLSVLAAAIALSPLIVNTMIILPKTEGSSIGDMVYHRMVFVYLFSGSVVVNCIYGLTILIGYFSYIPTKVAILVFLGLEILFALIMKWATRSRI
jgi:hypothetical protein